MDKPTFELYTKPNCGYCFRAKAALQQSGLRYTEKRLDIDFTREELLNTFPNAKTYPVIVMDGFNIGGAEQLETLLLERSWETGPGGYLTEA